METYCTDVFSPFLDSIQYKTEFKIDSARCSIEHRHSADNALTAAIDVENTLVCEKNRYAIYQRRQQTVSE